MKPLHQFLLALILAVIALAHPASGTISGLNYVSSPTINSMHPGIGPHDKVYRYADLMSGPEPVNRYPNLTVSTTAGADGPFEGDYTVAFRMSETKQHVAEFHGQRLFDLIHNSLLRICPYERGRIGCYETMPGAGKPNDDGTLTYKYASKDWILDVPYKTDKGEYATNAWITITARAIFRNRVYPGIGAATYEMAAGIYLRVTENWANCYDESFNTESRPYQFCNVPKHVLVAFPTNNGQVTESWLSMTVEFNGPSKHGRFDCSGTRASVENFWETAVRPDVAKSMGYAETEWNTCTSCCDSDNCFDIKKWRQWPFCA